MTTENKFIEKWIVLDEKTNEFKGIGDAEYPALSVGHKQLKFIEISALEQLRAENERLKKTVEYQIEKYKELDSKPSDFQIMENQVMTILQLKSKLAKAKEVLKSSEAALKKVHKHGFSHYEDCEFLEYEEDEDLCDCGSFIYLSTCRDTTLKIAEVLKEIGCQDEKK